MTHSRFRKVVRAVKQERHDLVRETLLVREEHLVCAAPQVREVCTKRRPSV